MKPIHTSSILALALASVSNAYPNIAAAVARNRAAPKVEGRSVVDRILHPRQSTFNAEQQYISNQGAHAFVAPSDTDQRGPCPGLNALANHNYLPHDGVATIQEFIDATNEVFGMGEDLGMFLSTYGAVADGDLTSWSIGGATGLVGDLAGITGDPQGISGSHNKYEGDGSPTRGDLYQYGNDYLLQVNQFQGLYDAGKADDSYDIATLTSYRNTRFQQSISENPYFFYGPFSGIAVTPAAYTFIFRYMANNSAANPDGYLDGDVLKSFFSITGTDGNFTYTPGWESIPDNWYRRPLDNPYGTVFFLSDLVAAGVQYPQWLVPGGNTGTVDSYTGIDVANLTGGVFSAGNLVQGNNAACFALQLTVQFLPDYLSGLLTDVAAGEDKIGPVINNITDSLGCPQLNAVDKGQFSQYPGYANLNADGTGYTS